MTTYFDTEVLRHLIGYLTPEQIHDSVKTLGEERVKNALNNVGALPWFKGEFT